MPAAVGQDIALIGIGIDKHDFHVYGRDRHGKALLRKKFSRKQLIEFLAKFHACISVVMEACAGVADDEAAQRLMTIPGIGPITASILFSETGEGTQSRCGRDPAATLSLMPRQSGTGCRDSPGRHQQARRQESRRLLVRVHANVVACTLASKAARIVRAIAAHQTSLEMKEAPMHA